MPLVQLQAPAVEPVSLAEARLHLRIDDDMTADDALIGLLIGAARRYCESYLSLISQRWRLVLDRFPGIGDMYVPEAYTSNPGNAILLERGPVLSVESINWRAMDGATQAVSTPTRPAYAVELSGPIPRITPGFGRIWPVPLPEIGAVWVDYTAGYGAAATDVPEGIRHWLLLRLTTLYENREEVATLHRGAVAPLPWVDSLLDPYRVVWA